MNEKCIVVLSASIVSDPIKVNTRPHPHFFICVINFVRTSLSGLSLSGLGTLGCCSTSGFDFDFLPALAAFRARRDGRTRVMPECPFGWLVDVDGEFSPPTSKSSISTDWETNYSANCLTEWRAENIPFIELSPSSPTTSQLNKLAWYVKTQACIMVSKLVLAFTYWIRYNWALFFVSILMEQRDPPAAYSCTARRQHGVLIEPWSCALSFFASTFSTHLTGMLPVLWSSILVYIRTAEAHC